MLVEFTLFELVKLLDEKGSRSFDPTQEKMKKSTIDDIISFTSQVIQYKIVCKGENNEDNYEESHRLP